MLYFETTQEYDNIYQQVQDVVPINMVWMANIIPTNNESDVDETAKWTWNISMVDGYGKSTLNTSLPVTTKILPIDSFPQSMYVMEECARK